MNQLNFLQSLGWALLNSLWQMALLWLIYIVVTGMFPKLKAGNKASLGILFTISGFAWFIYTFLYSFLSENNLSIYYGTKSIAGNNIISSFFENILPVVTIIYLLALIIPVLNFIKNYRYVNTIRTTGLKKIDAGWRVFAKTTASAMGIARDVKIWLSEHVISPVTVGYLKPVILIPVAAMNNLTQQQLEAIILHELSHIHRFDYFFNLIVNFIRTILYFNPFVNLLIKNIEKEREYSCDELVLQYQYKPGEYASALLRIEQNNRNRMMMAASGKNHDLLHRIESILGIERKTNYQVKRFTFAVLSFLIIVATNIVLSVKEEQKQANAYSFNGEFSPYYLFNSYPAATKANNSLVKSSVKKIVPAETPMMAYDVSFQDEAAAPGFYNVNYNTPVVPELPDEEEVKIKGVVDATKKILEEKEWKEMEKTYADVYNSSEKSQLKNEFKKQVEKIDWQNLENKLKLSNETINWDKVNSQIKESLAVIKLDSIQNHLTVCLDNFASLEKMMKDNKISSIPDTEITLRKLAAEQQKARTQLEKVNAVKNKKIVRI